MALLGVDIGTTHCKAGLFRQDGVMLAQASSPTISRLDPQGFRYYNPDELWNTIAAVIRTVADQHASSIAAVGISSMAETGLLVDRHAGGEAVSPMLPWFDTCSTEQAVTLSKVADPFLRFQRSGIRPSYKCSLAKMLWLRDQGISSLDACVWLSAADWAAFHLTGKMATDYSLAVRTYAFRLDTKSWDDDWLRDLGFPPDCLPAVWPSGAVMGHVTQDGGQAVGLAAGTPVAIAGHDHICAAFAAGVIHPGQALDSMGTAEALLGAMDERSLEERDYRTGLSYGSHVAPGRMYWLGGLTTSGGSLDWLRSLLAEPALSYERFDQLATEMSTEPGELFFFPYLAGSGSPHTDQHVRGAFVGLSASHGQVDLLKAALEGIAYEMEVIRRAGEQVTGTGLASMIAVGGGTRIPHWLQMKADITGCRYTALEMPEATLAGAALLAGIGQGLNSSPTEALGAWQRPTGSVVDPDGYRHAIYTQKFLQGYLKYQDPLRAFHHSQGVS